MTIAMEGRWRELMARMGFSPNLDAFKDLVRRYDAPGRHYHTMDHIRACLAHLEDYPGALDDREAIALALWYHDAVYRPLRRDNEVRSAQLAEQFVVSAGGDQSRARGVAALIRMTEHPSNPQSDDERVMCDVDLAILGAPFERFDAYEAQIRREYWMVPGWLYRRGRRRLLERMRAHGPLYYTEHFQALFEARAQANLQRALEQLG